MPIAQLAPWQRLGLAPFTTSTSELMKLDWDNTISLGSPADFVLLEASSWIDALSSPPEREVIVAGQWLINSSIEDTPVLN